MELCEDEVVLWVGEIWCGVGCDGGGFVGLECVFEFVEGGF